MINRPSRTILANTVSSVMADRPSDAYRRAMAVVTPRKLWQARPGDCVVMLAPCSRAFRAYVADVACLDVDRVEIIAPSEIRGVHALEVVANLGVLDQVISRPEIKPFVLDEPVFEFSRRTGIRILPYTRPPESNTLAAISLINTKDGFRRIAAGLGLPVADGGFAARPAELASKITEFLTDHPAAIVKTNRGSNGFGNTVVAIDGDRSVHEQVDDIVPDRPEGGSGWVFEEFLPFAAAPSIEAQVNDDGVIEFYSCDQRTVNNAWTGMVTPAANRPHYEDLRIAATRIGSWLYEQGYRGFFDVDGGVYDNEYVVTEANVRRTGGTYLEELAQLLRPNDSPVHWRADVRVGNTRLDFETAARKLASAGLCNPKAEARAVLTADTVAADGKWRYLVVGADDDSIAEVERGLERILGIG